MNSDRRSTGFRYILRLPEIASLAPDALIASLAPTVQRYMTDPIT